MTSRQGEKAETLKSVAGPAEFGNHTCKDRHQFIRLAQEGSDLFAGNSAVVAKQFQPELRFIRFLQQAVQL